jgi:hypothetical protein
MEMNKALVSILAVAALVAVISVPAFAGATVQVPEPATLLLVATGIGAVAIVRRLRK